MGLQIVQLDPRTHDRAGFACGNSELDAYLQRQAGQHYRDGLSTTHVITDEAEPARILGYCTLAAAQLQFDELQIADQKRLPAYPVPCVRLARLAVVSGAQSRGLGRLLLGHAVNCAQSMRAYAGVAMLVVDAKDDQAAAFYRAHGFRETAAQARTLYMHMGQA